MHNGTAKICKVGRCRDTVPRGWISWLVGDVVGPNRLDEALRTLANKQIRAYSIIHFSASIHCMTVCFMFMVLILVGLAGYVPHLLHSGS